MVVGLSFLSCAQVEIKDQTWYGSKGIAGAIEVHTLANIPNQDISDIQFISMWHDTTHPMIATSIDTFAEIKKEFEQLCTNSGDCTYAQQIQKKRMIKFLDKLIFSTAIVDY